MAFNKAQLQSDFEAVFESMTDGNEDTFPNGISNAVVTFVSGGQVSTTDVGAVSGGSFSGRGAGSLTVTASACAQIIKSACTVMKTMTSGGDNYLAEQMGKGFKAMADSGVVMTTVTGVLTPPPPATPISPYGGSAKGTISCTETTLIANLKLLFKKMYNQRETEGFDGNKEFAKELANEINTFYTNGQVSTDGLANIAGSKGTGSIS